MFARFRNLFAKSKGEDEGEEAPRPEVPSIVVVEPPNEEEAPSSAEIESQLQSDLSGDAPLASEEEDLAHNPDEILSNSTTELSRLLDAINEASKLPETSSDDTQGEDYDDDDDDETASTSSVKTKIAKASIERDIILEETEDDEDEVDAGPPVPSLDKIKALIRNDSETYPQSDYTDNETPSHSRTASMDSGPPDNPRFSGDFSIVADELPLDCSPSPLHDSGRTSSEPGSEVSPGDLQRNTVQVTPTGGNELACAAISHKLGAIAEVAESLDAVIRDVQLQEEDAVNPGNTGHAIKKLGSIEDWQSRSTEDESFATASEGNFTPNSHSSSFQTASGRTSSYIGSAKNSFDEADDSTLSTFEIPELPTSPVNFSYDSSDLSYFSAHQPQNLRSEDQDSVAGVADLHSQSATPTPDEEQQHLLLPLPLPQAIESDSEVEGFTLSTGVTTENAARMSNAHTPEVSCQPADYSAPASTNPNDPKPPTSWRRSKYYENITKQTIKGFL